VNDNQFNQLMHRLDEIERKVEWQANPGGQFSAEEKGVILDAEELEATYQQYKPKRHVDFSAFAKRMLDNKITARINGFLQASLVCLIGFGCAGWWLYVALN